MSPLHKEFYRLDELAERWQQTENNLLQMAAGGQLRLSCFFRGEYKGVVCKSVENPSHAEIMDIFEHLEEQPDRFFAGYFDLCVVDVKDIAVNWLKTGRSYKTKGIKIAEADWRLAKGDWLLLSDIFQYSTKDILVLAHEVERVEADMDMLKAFPLAKCQQDDAPGDDSSNTGGHDIIGMVKLKAYFFPVTWGTIKNWLGEAGINDPPKGEVWKAPESVCREIMVKKYASIQRKRKNVK